MDLILLCIYIGVFLTDINYSMLASFYALEAESKGLTNLEIGIIFSIFSFVELITALILGRFMHY